MSAEALPALKEMFNAARYRQIADLLAAAYPAFDRKRFLALTNTGLAERSLLQRLRRTTEACRATLPADYRAALAVLRQVAPRIEHNFVGIFLADFVGQYGHDHFDESMAALAVFTRHGSAEFAIREFLRRDLARTLAVMTVWSRDPDEHVRRLASEGCRPRLPWSFQLTELIRDPVPVWPILTAMRADPSLYVRKSVANHLNDISKDHPDWLLGQIADWDVSHPETGWIIKRALRTLIKRGDRRALTVIGAGQPAKVRVEQLALSPGTVRIGSVLQFGFTLTSTAKVSQRLVIDYVVHYQKKTGRSSPKVFKLAEIDLAPGATIAFTRRLRFTDFTTRVHHPGRHRWELMVNGTVQTGRDFRVVR